MGVTNCVSCHSSFAPIQVNRGRQIQTSKCPLLLKCGHTFCEQCLSQISKKRVSKSKADIEDEFSFKAEITCPMCKHPTLLRNGVKDLPTNLYMTAVIGTNYNGKVEQELSNFVPLPTKKLLQKSIDSRKASELHCSFCKTKVANCECKDCENKMCLECFNSVHNVSAVLRHHKPIQFKPKQALLETTKRDTICKEHGKQIEYFCTHDETPICSRCYINGSHHKHPIVSFEEKNKHFVELIQNELPQASAVLSYLKKIDKRLLSAMPTFRSETRAVLDDINKYFISLHAYLQAKEVELVEQVTTAYNVGLHELEKKRIYYEATKFDLENTVKEAKQLFENNALVIDAESLLQRVREAKDIPCILVEDDLKKNCLKWHEKGTTDILSAIRNLGDVDGDMNGKVQFKTVSEIDIPADDDNESISSLSSLSSAISSLDVLSVCSIATTVGTGDNEIQDNEDTDGDTSSAKDSYSHLSKLKATKEQINQPNPKGASQKVMVTHIISPNSFFVHLASNRKKLETLSHNMNIWCKSASSQKHIPLTLEVNQWVLARYSEDDQWYRASVLSMEESTGRDGKSRFQVRVRYMDFGNDDTVAMKDLRTMPDRFKYYPEFKIHCSLHDIAPFDENGSWEVDVIHEFQRLTNEETLMMNTLAKNIDGFQVDLTFIPSTDVSDDLFVSVRDVLIFLEFARFKHHSDQASFRADPPSYSKSDYISASMIKSNAVVDIEVCQALTPWDFHIRAKGEESSYYSSMMEQMQELYKGSRSMLYQLQYPRCGVLCVAQWKDGQWYRAKVLEAPKKRMVKVELVDVGEVLMVRYDKLLKIHQDFIKLAVQAVRCKLADVSPADGSDSWSTEAQHWCQTVLVKSSGKARFIRWGPLAEIVLWLGQKCDQQVCTSINTLLVIEQMACSSGPSSVSTAHDASKSLPSYTVNESGYINFSSDSTRARTSSASSSTIASPHKSSGSNTPVPSPVKATVAKLKLSSPEKNIKPVMLLEHHSLKDSTEGYNLKSEKSKKTVKLSRSRKKAPRGPPVQNKREESPSESAREAKKKTQIQENIHRAVSVESGVTDAEMDTKPKYVEVIMSYFVSPSNFCLRIKEKEKELTDLMSALQKACKNSETSSQTWAVNMSCAVRKPEDPKWYRGTIKSMTELEKAQVELVDYGQIVEVSVSTDLQVLTPEFCKTQCAVIRCYLADLIPTGTMDVTKWSRTATDYMSGQIFEKNLFVKLIGEPGDEGVPVDIIIEEIIPETAFDPASHTYHSLRHLILEEGLARPSKNLSPDPRPEAVNPFERTIFAETKLESFVKTNIDDNQDGLDSAEIATSSRPLEQDQMSISRGKPVLLPEMPEPELYSSHQVVPTFVGWDGTIYSQPVDWENQIYQMYQELQRVYQVEEYRHLAWQPGELCVALYPVDGTWYRARILQIQKSGSIKVLYIDYGNTAIISPNEVREMYPQFASMHILAYNCVLYEAKPLDSNGKWEEETLAHIHDYVVNQQCDIIVLGKNESSLLVILKNDSNIEFPEYLFKNNLALNNGSLSKEYSISEKIDPIWTDYNPYNKLDAADLRTDLGARVLMTGIELPNVIYLQRLKIPESHAVDIVSAGEVAEFNNQIEEFVKMSEELHNSSSMHFVALPQVGQICAGIYNHDKRWYRALCVDQDLVNDCCLLLFVDYGSLGEVPRSNIRILREDFWSLPAQALRCHLNILPPEKDNQVFRKYSYDAVVQTLGLMEELIVRVKQTSPLTVELFEEKKGQLRLAYEELISSGLVLLDPDVIVEKHDDDQVVVKSGSASGVMDDSEGVCNLADVTLVAAQCEDGTETKKIEPELTKSKMEVIGHDSSCGESTSNEDEGSSVDWFECTDGDVSKHTELNHKNEKEMGSGDQ